MSHTPETYLGFKRITADNWQRGGLPPGMLPENADDWLLVLLEPQLGSHVPTEIGAHPAVRPERKQLIP